MHMNRSWYRIGARSSSRFWWVKLECSGGQDPLFFEVAPGYTIMEAVADGNMHLVPFDVWAKKNNYGAQLGDIIFSQGAPLKIVSTRFVEALRSVDASGYHTFEIDLRDNKDQIVSGYVGFALDLKMLNADVQSFNGVQFDAFAVNSRVLEALKDSGIDGLVIEPLSDELLGRLT